MCRTGMLRGSSRGCPQQVVRVALVNFGERHRHTDKRAALHRSRPPADQSGKRVASSTGKSPDTPDLSRTSWRGSREDATRKMVPWNLSFIRRTADATRPNNGAYCARMRALAGASSQADGRHAAPTRPLLPLVPDIRRYRPPADVRHHRPARHQVPCRYRTY